MQLLPRGFERIDPPRQLTQLLLLLVAELTRFVFLSSRFLFFLRDLCLRLLRRALSEVIVVAAVILFDRPTRLEREDAGNDVVEEGAVVADEKDGSLVVDEEAFEELEGLDIEIVGRLVHHQDV